MLNGKSSKHPNPHSDKYKYILYNEKHAASLSHGMLIQRRFAPLIPLVDATIILVPLVLAALVPPTALGVPSTALGDLALCGRKACWAGHRSKEPAELCIGMYSEPLPYTTTGTISTLPGD